MVRGVGSYNAGGKAGYVIRADISVSRLTAVSPSITTHRHSALVANIAAWSWHPLKEAATADSGEFDAVMDAREPDPISPNPKQ